MPVLSPVVTPYYGGKQSVNPSTVIATSGAPSTKLTNLDLGTLAVDNSTGTMYGLVSLSGGNATWTVLGGGSGALATLTGNTGGAIAPTGGNINVIGAGALSFAGSGSTLTGSITPGTTLVSTLTGSTSGGAISPTAGNITFAAGTGMTITGSGSTITFDATGAVGVTTLTGTSGGPISPTAGNITFAGGAGVTIVGSGSTLTINVAGGTGTMETLTGNTGGAISPSSGNTNILGSGVLSFAGSGSTLTGSITPGTSLVSTLTGSTSGGAISPTAGNINLKAGTGMSITGSGSDITFDASAAVGVTTLTGDTGGAISPTSGNITISGGTSGSFAGSGSTLTLSLSAGRYPITPYVVGPVGKADYQTIQAAITAASGAGGGLVYIQPGSYAESLTLADGVYLMGTSYQSTDISGTHTLPSSGSISFSRLKLTGTTEILASVAAGTTKILLDECQLNLLSTGYSVDAANWIGQINIQNCYITGINDSIVNSSGLVVLDNLTSLAGSAGPLVANGGLLVNSSTLPCGASVGTGGCRIISSYLLGTVTVGAFTTSIFNSTIISGSNAAISGSGGGNIALSNCVISSNSATYVLEGTCNIAFSNVSFLQDYTVDPTTTIVDSGTSASSCSLNLSIAGSKLSIATGTNASVGTSGAMTAGTVTVNTTAITANSLVFLTPASLGTVTVPSSLYVSARTPGTSFTITSSAPTDTSTVNWWIIN